MKAPKIMNPTRENIRVWLSIKIHCRIISSSKTNYYNLIAFLSNSMFRDTLDQYFKLI